MGSTRAPKMPILAKQNDETPIIDQDIMVLGQLGAPFGVRGWLKVQSFTEPRQALLDYSPWYLLRQGHWELAEVEESRPHGQGMVVKLKGCDTPEEGRCLTLTSIGIMREQLPALESGEYYWSELIGLDVVNEQGVSLGKLDYLIETGANDVIAVKDDQEQEHLLPFVMEHVVKKVDLAKRTMVVDWDLEF